MRLISSLLLAAITFGTYIQASAQSTKGWDRVDKYLPYVRYSAFAADSANWILSEGYCGSRRLQFDKNGSQSKNGGSEGSSSTYTNVLFKRKTGDMLYASYEFDNDRKRLGTLHFESGYSLIYDMRYDREMDQPAPYEMALGFAEAHDGCLWMLMDKGGLMRFEAEETYMPPRKLFTISAAGTSISAGPGATVLITDALGIVQYDTTGLATQKVLPDKKIAHLKYWAGQGYLAVAADSLYLLDNSLSIVRRYGFAVPWIAVNGAMADSILVITGETKNNLPLALALDEDLKILWEIDNLPGHYSLKQAARLGNRIGIAGIDNTKLNQRAGAAFVINVPLATGKMEPLVSDAGIVGVYPRKEYIRKAAGGYPDSMAAADLGVDVNLEVKNYGLDTLQDITIYHQNFNPCWEYEPYASKVYSNLHLAPGETRQLNLGIIWNLRVFHSDRISKEKPYVFNFTVSTHAPNNRLDAQPLNDNFSYTYDYLNQGEVPVSGIGTSLLEEAMIFPSPATNDLNLTFSTPLSGSLTLLNYMGQPLQSKVISSQSQATFDVSAYAAGMYIIRYTQANGIYSSRKVLVGK